MADFWALSEFIYNRSDNGNGTFISPARRPGNDIIGIPDFVRH